MTCAVWHGQHDVRVERRPVPEPSGDEVLVKVAACGICATDLHLITGSYGSHRPPKVLGHEVSGTVQAVGPGVIHLRVGDRVALDPTLPCRACNFCRMGRPFLCRHRTTPFGGFAEYLLLPEWQSYRLPDGLPLAAGSMAEPLSCCLHGLDLARMTPGGSAVVLGAGPLGLLMLQLLKRQGAAVCVVSEPDAGRRALALRMGATHVVDPGSDSLVNCALEATDGVGPDAVFEMTGVDAVVQEAVSLARPGGTVILLGLTDPEAKVWFNPQALVLREVSIHGAFVRAQDDFRRAVELLPTLDLEPFLGCGVPLEQIGEALRLAGTRSTLKVLVLPGHTD